MQKFWNRIKAGVKALAIISAAIFFLLGLSSSVKKQNNLLCRDVLVDIDYSDGVGFIDEHMVREELIRYDMHTLAGRLLKGINLSDIEKMLDRNPFVSKAQVYSNTAGDIIIGVSQKQPIIRLINKDRVSFYLTENKEVMPLSDIFTVRLIVASGNIHSTGNKMEADELELFEKLLRLVQFIEADPFWKAMISQIEVIDDSEFMLIPILGDHKIEFGDIDEEMGSKFSDLKTIYKEGMKYTGWSQYEKINLKFRNQIVCTKH